MAKVTVRVRQYTWNRVELEEDDIRAIKKWIKDHPKAEKVYGDEKDWLIVRALEELELPLMERKYTQFYSDIDDIIWDDQNELTAQEVLDSVE